MNPCKERISEIPGKLINPQQMLAIIISIITLLLEYDENNKDCGIHTLWYISQL